MQQWNGITPSTRHYGLNNQPNAAYFARIILTTYFHMRQLLSIAIRQFSNILNQLVYVQLISLQYIILDDLTAVWSLHLKHFQ